MIHADHRTDRHSTHTPPSRYCKPGPAPGFVVSRAEASKPRTIPIIMAIKLIANYSKKLGLPCYSSHGFGASVEVELTDLSQVEEQCSRLYELLQQSVDRNIQTPGFVPDETYGITPHSNGNGNSHHAPKPIDAWNCTEGQRGFIQRILNENKIPVNDAEDIANQLFGLGVKQLNKMQASQLIEELLTKAGKTSRPSRWRPVQPATSPS